MATDRLEAVAPSPARSFYNQNLNPGRLDVPHPNADNRNGETLRPSAADFSAVLAGAQPERSALDTLERHAVKHGGAVARPISDSQDSNATTVGESSTDAPDSSSSTSDHGFTSIQAENNQLHRLSTLATASDQMVTSPNPELGMGASKRTADGELKARRYSASTRSVSPVKGHSRNVSAVSMASTASTIGELSAELKTRLSYAMVKVNNGWQSHSLDEVESLHRASSSQAVSLSPSSSSSTVHRRHESSTSPRVVPSEGSNKHSHLVYFTHGEGSRIRRRSSGTPPGLAGKPTLAPPARIQPSSSQPALPASNPRRNSNPRYTPTMLSHTQSHSNSPHTPYQPPKLNTSQPGAHLADAAVYSPRQTPHQKVLDQDAAEALLFMSSPGNSANLKHNFTPTGSPGPQSHGSSNAPVRRALPSGPRKTLPNERPSQKNTGFSKSPMPPPVSPMDVDYPQRQTAATDMGREITNGLHMRAPLYSGGNTKRRNNLNDADIERMLDEADNDSSDDEDIRFSHQTGVANPMGV